MSENGSSVEKRLKALTGVTLVLAAGLLTAELIRFRATAQNPTESEHIQRIIDFEKHWNAYLLDLAGCRDKIWSSTCDPKKGVQNIEEWLKARNAAKKLFSLHEPPKR
jgi:hypothetical protein